MGLVVETRRFIGREIADQDVGRHGLRDVLESHGSGSDTEYRYGASQCGSLNNTLNPSLGLKKLMFRTYF
jgi:hypothetical protein